MGTPSTRAASWASCFSGAGRWPLTGVRAEGRGRGREGRLRTGTGPRKPAPDRDAAAKAGSGTGLGPRFLLQVPVVSGVPGPGLRAPVRTWCGGDGESCGSRESARGPRLALGPARPLIVSGWPGWGPRPGRNLASALGPFRSRSSAADPVPGWGSVQGPGGSGTVRAPAGRGPAAREAVSDRDPGPAASARAPGPGAGPGSGRDPAGWAPGPDPESGRAVRGRGADSSWLASGGR